MNKRYTACLPSLWRPGGRLRGADASPVGHKFFCAPPAARRRSHIQPLLPPCTASGLYLAVRGFCGVPANASLLLVCSPSPRSACPRSRRPPHPACCTPPGTSPNPAAPLRPLPPCRPQVSALTALERVSVLSEALPYLQKFRGKVIVVKYGGAAMKDPTLKVLLPLVVPHAAAGHCLSAGESAGGEGTLGMRGCRAAKQLCAVGRCVCVVKNANVQRGRAEKQRIALTGTALALPCRRG